MRLLPFGSWPTRGMTLALTVILALLLMGSQYSSVQAQNAQCYDFGAQIAQFRTAYMADADVIDSLSQQRNRVDEEAARFIQTYWGNTEWTFCTNGALRITTYYDGAPNRAYDGQWASDGSFAVGASDTSGFSVSQVQIQGRVNIQNSQLIDGAVVLDIVGGSSGSANDSSYNHASHQYAEFLVQFYDWQEQPQAAAGTLTADMAVQLLASIRPNYQDITVLGKTQCAVGVWQVFMNYNYYSEYLGWMPYATNYLFQDQGNGQWYIIEGTC